MKILVTGGSGFIGSAVVRHAIADTEVHIVNVDKLTYAASPEALAGVQQSPRYRFEHVDVCDAAELRRVFDAHAPDAVMHLAAESHVDRSIDAPAEFIQTNIVGTYTLLQEALRYYRSLAGARQAAFRFHHVSTDEVFGSLPLGDAPGFHEESPYAPSSPYSASKASADHLVRAWHHTFGLPVVVSNCSNNYGPYQFPEKLIPLMIIKALAGERLPVYGKGENVRDWLHVEDHARALFVVLGRGAVGRQLQHRRPQRAAEPRRRAQDLRRPGSRRAGRAHRQAPRSGQLRHRSPRPRSALRHRLRAHRARARVAPRRDLRQRPRKDRAAGTSITARGGKRSSTAATRASASASPEAGSVRRGTPRRAAHGVAVTRSRDRDRTNRSAFRDRATGWTDGAPARVARRDGGAAGRWYAPAVDRAGPANKKRLPVVDGSALCVECGLCCSGVLFSHAPLREEELALAEEIGLSVAEPPGVGVRVPVSVSGARRHALRRVSAAARGVR